MIRRKFNQKASFKKPRINMQIRVPEVNLIDEKGKRMGILSVSEALKIANGKGLDLVEISPHASPPVAKIINFGKYMYEKERKEKSVKKQTNQELKTIRVGINTGEHDLIFKAKQANNFLKKGHPVKIDMFLRGREKALKPQAKEKIKEFPNYISVPHSIEEGIKSVPSGFNILLRPEKK